MPIQASTRPCANVSQHGPNDKHSHVILAATGTTDLSNINSVNSPIQDKNDANNSWTANLVRPVAADHVVIRLSRPHRGSTPATGPKKKGTKEGLDSGLIDITLTDSSGVTTTVS